MPGWIFVFLGGGLGSLFRYGIGLYYASHNTDFPLGTFVSNFIACLILGILIGIQLKESLQPQQSLLFITGFCGGFSTFSTFSAESLKLFQNQQYALGLIYIGGSIILGLLAVYLGIKLQSMI
ncbi:MAG: fluoride efflux transporter CrcB [Bacteroidota bacterium]